MRAAITKYDMKPNKFQSEAYAAIPADHAIVRDGPLQDSDLLWSIFEKRWRRRDDEDWLHRPDMAEDVVCAVRCVSLGDPKGEQIGLFQEGGLN